MFAAWLYGVILDTPGMFASCLTFYEICGLMNYYSLEIMLAQEMVRHFRDLFNHDVLCYKTQYTFLSQN